MATLQSPAQRPPLRADAHCVPPPASTGSGRPALGVGLVGPPNVGKSALFNRLTGRYAAVSNYPGTSVELMRGHGTFGGAVAEVVDTPGLYSLLVSTEE